MTTLLDDSITSLTENRRATRRPSPSRCEPARGDRALYEALLDSNAGTDDAANCRAHAREYLRRALAKVQADTPSDLPASPTELPTWMQRNVEKTGAQYRDYLARRKAGGAREYFSTRSHALFFLRSVAPTKLVDGAWLYGLLPHWQNPKLAHLVHTYVEELGDGAPDKNHVLLYRRLLQSHGIDDWAELPDSHYVQGALQLSLAACGHEFLPEILGFNLGYEQLPLHLPITAYELDELGIDPYYFTLHVTVDNAASGHARRAVNAVLENLPHLADRDSFWARVRRGYRLNDAGVGTTDVIASFDPLAELARIVEAKALEGQFAHADRCRIEGRTVNDWLAADGGADAFIGALARKGWLQAGSGPEQSRFWQLLQGPQAPMFGVFSGYELQVVYDHVRGAASCDGAAVPAVGDARGAVPARPYRLQRRAPADLRQALQACTDAVSNQAPPADPDMATLHHRLRGQDHADSGATMNLLLRLMGPAQHWSLAGLSATRTFVESFVRARTA